MCRTALKHLRLAVAERTEHSGRRGIRGPMRRLSPPVCWAGVMVGCSCAERRCRCAPKIDDRLMAERQGRARCLTFGLTRHSTGGKASGELEVARQPGDIEHLPQLCSYPAQDDALGVTAELPSRAHQDGQPGRVDEKDLGEVKFESVVPGAPNPLDSRRELRCGGVVEMAREDEPHSAVRRVLDDRKRSALRSGRGHSGIRSRLLPPQTG